jgi:hypothetical protein
MGRFLQDPVAGISDLGIKKTAEVDLFVFL